MYDLDPGFLKNLYFAKYKFFKNPKLERYLFYPNLKVRPVFAPFINVNHT